MRASRCREGWIRFGVGLCIALALPTGVARAQIVINEIDYDQAGVPDSRDFIELHEPTQTGMSLTGWQLILYNGQSSQRSPYLTINLADAPGGVMPPDGYLVIGPMGVVPNVDIPSPSGGWIQNGSPDGMALVHAGDVIELLAYEGSFVGNTNGTGGPATGMTFPDIGVAEYGGDCNGLQRLPDGGSWITIPEAAATPGRACDVDLGDFHELQSCLAGPNTPPAAGCSTQDWDCDGDVDLDDFAEFQIAFTNPPCS